MDKLLDKTLTSNENEFTNNNPSSSENEKANDSENLLNQLSDNKNLEELNTTTTNDFDSSNENDMIDETDSLNENDMIDETNSSLDTETSSSSTLNLTSEKIPEKLDEMYYEDDESDNNNTYNKNFMPSKTTEYKTKKALYEDNYSSGVILIFFSVVGVIFDILNYVGILSIFTSAFQLIVSMTMFIAFMALGIYSIKKSILYKSQINEENIQTTELNNFLMSKVTNELLQTFDTPDDSEEENYLNRIQGIKNLVNEKFDNLDDNFIDSIIEDFYNNNF